VVNTQRAVRQIWVAGKSQGIHFSWNGARWIDDKAKGLELFAWVAECVEAACGQKLSFE
jgi:CyaY protein